ncbi:MAG TPA: VCBS repeat-containing protein, partial [Bryobacteraceae bacterium]|nr:VCBS repeat-containing protein [Bryobacteraceae bacterium]
YYGWGATTGDINKDGIPDVISGPFYYLGPTYTERRIYREGRQYNPATEYAPDMVNYAADFTGDGFVDILSTEMRAMALYVNPAGESRRWQRYMVLPEITTEIVLLRDVDGDGKPEIIYGGATGYAWAKPDPKDPTAKWPIHHISTGTSNIHGLGAGDINGDGKLDVITPGGWYEQPADGAAHENWPFHEYDFAITAPPGVLPGGGMVGVYDVNGDGLNDVVTSLASHDWGLAWFEQKRAADKSITFVKHMIARDFSTKNAGGVVFSEPHASAFADIDGDGIPDFVVGKSLWHHLENYNGPDPYGPAVVYVYRTVRNPKAEGGAEFVPELVNNRSGVGSSIAITDLNKDGAADIITASGKGTFIFFGKPGKWKK